MSAQRQWSRTGAWAVRHGSFRDAQHPLKGRGCHGDAADDHPIDGARLGLSVEKERKSYDLSGVHHRHHASNDNFVDDDRFAYANNGIGFHGAQYILPRTAAFLPAGSRYSHLCDRYNHGSVISKGLTVSLADDDGQVSRLNAGFQSAAHRASNCSKFLQILRRIAQ
jgi:hypothetical protein